MRKEEYHEYLNTEEWKARATEAKNRAGWRCQLCDSEKHLQAHHRTYKYVGTPEELDDLTVLCDRCHKKFHGIIKKKTKRQTKRTPQKVEESRLIIEKFEGVRLLLSIDAIFRERDRVSEYQEILNTINSGIEKWTDTPTVTAAYFVAGCGLAGAMNDLRASLLAPDLITGNNVLYQSISIKHRHNESIAKDLCEEAFHYGNTRGFVPLPRIGLFVISWCDAMDILSMKKRAKDLQSKIEKAQEVGDLEIMDSLFLEKIQIHRKIEDISHRDFGLGKPLSSSMCFEFSIEEEPICV